MLDLNEAQRRQAVHYFYVLQSLSDSYVQSGNVDSTIAEFKSEWDQIREGQAWSKSRMSEKRR
jgi:hypothetical protein